MFLIASFQTQAHFTTVFERFANDSQLMTYRRRD
jgi:hypothetical protein